LCFCWPQADQVEVPAIQCELPCAERWRIAWKFTSSRKKNIQRPWKSMLGLSHWQIQSFELSWDRSGRAIEWF
jgi:hypothetical protein